jgi:hypothetical protein
MILLCFRGYASKKSNIIVSVKTAKVPVSGRKRLVNLHVLKQSIVGKKGMCHPDTMWLHGMTLPIIIITNIWIIEIAYFSLYPIRCRRERIAADIHTHSVVFLVVKVESSVVFAKFPAPNYYHETNNPE